MAGGGAIILVYILGPILLSLLFPFLSWAIGRWYQDRLMSALLLNEKQQGQIFFMWFKSIFGGRLHSYDVVLDYGRREALLRLNQQAKNLGCSSVVNIRIETSTVSFAKNDKSNTSSVEFLAFATGIRQ